MALLTATCQGFSKSVLDKRGKRTPGLSRDQLSLGEQPIVKTNSSPHDIKAYAYDIDMSTVVQS
jgi:hypothetical protein